jgi:pimeloyl-ACP methyl ester carboxylesterase
MASFIDRGTGTPLLMVPGLQGHWQWMSHAVDALAATCRVVTFSLEEHGGAGFDDYVSQVDAALDRATLARAVIVGVSFGGLIAARYAARRPERTAALVLVVTPSPHWQDSKRQRDYLAHPRLFYPLFVLRAIAHLVPEVVAAIPSMAGRLRFLAAYGGLTLRHRASPDAMAERVRRWQAVDLEADCRTIHAPTLLVTGEPALDRVVDTARSLDYLDLIPGSRRATLDRTGHLGLITRPRAFAAVVGEFVGREAPAYDR